MPCCPHKNVGNMILEGHKRNIHQSNPITSNRNHSHQKIYEMTFLALPCSQFFSLTPLLVVGHSLPKIFLGLEGKAHRPFEFEVFATSSHKSFLSFSTSASCSFSFAKSPFSAWKFCCTASHPSSNELDYPTS